ncbi:MAG: hypothetical protein WAS73_17250 [Defluviicoccus sp.]
MTQQDRIELPLETHDDVRLQPDTVDPRHRSPQGDADWRAQAC